jgi:hypothetical protein
VKTPSDQDTLLDFYFGYAPAALDAMREHAPYTHMIRAPGDPERRARGHVHKLGLAPHLGLAAYSHEQLRHMLWDTLGACPGEPLTFHALSVHLFDLGADVTGCGVLDRALFSLVCDGHVAMTLQAPILFMRACDLSEPSRPPGLYEPVPEQQGCLFG